MCGILGKIYFDQSRVIDKNLIRDMNNTMTHRGPDDEGYYVEGNMGNLRLYDPRWLDIEWRNKLEKDTLYYEVQVAPRKLVVFPTFLSHDVSEYTDETSMRISLDTGIEVK